MNTRVAIALSAWTLLTTACGSAPAPPPPLTVHPVEVTPAGAQPVSTAPASADTDCDPEASLRPGPLPPPGEMPAGSAVAAIAQRGRLIVGVDQNTYLFGYRNPTTGELEGFDVDIAREIARAIFGDPDRIDPRVFDASQRESALMSGDVDLVVRTYSVTCERKNMVAFSSVYYYANQRILAMKDSGIHSAADLGDRRVCTVSGTTSLARLLGLNPQPKLTSAANWTDCLVMLQQGQVDAISTDDSVLAGLAKQDPNVEIVGPSMGIEPYGIGVKRENGDLVRFVNAALERMRADGTWERLYDRWLLSLAPSPGPPAPRYQDRP